MPGQFHTSTDYLDPFCNEVRIEAEGLSDSAIEHYVKRSIIEFSEKSHFWQEDIGPIRVVTTSDTYEVIPGPFNEIVDIKGIYTTDDNGDQVELEYGQTATGWRYYNDSPIHIRVAPIEDLAGRDLLVNCALKPKEFNGEFKFSSLIASDYHDTIISGAKSKIFMMPNKEWTDLNLAKYHKVRFESDANAALVRVGRQFSRINKRVSPKRRSYF